MNQIDILCKKGGDMMGNAIKIVLAASLITVLNYYIYVAIMGL